MMHKPFAPRDATLPLLFLLSLITTLLPADEPLLPTGLFRLPTGGTIVGPVLADGDDLLVAASEDRYLYRIDGRGGIISRGDMPGLPAGFMSLAEDDTCYVSLTNGRLAAINPSGGLIWRESFPESLAADPVIGTAGDIYLQTATGRLVCIDHRGSIRWEEELEGGFGGQALITGEGLLIVPDGRGFIQAWLPWGELLWRFRLAGRLMVAVAGKRGLYTASTEGTLASVSAAGKLNWSITMAHPLRALIEEEDLLYGLSVDGRLISFEKESGNQRVLAAGLTSARSLLLAEAGIIAAGGSSRAYLIRPEEGETYSFAFEGVVEQPVISGNGILAGGGSDWNLHALGRVQAVKESWSYPGGDAGNRRNRGFIDGTVQPYWNSYPDYLLLSALMAEQSRESRILALDIIEERIGERRYPPFYGDFLRIIATEAYERPLMAGTRVVNDYPELRFRAVELLSREARLSSRQALIAAVREEWDRDIRIRAIQGLGRIGSDADGRATRVIASLIDERAVERDFPLCRTGMQALAEILRYQGRAPDRMLYESAIRVYRGSHDTEARRKALEILRFKE